MEKSRIPKIIHYCWFGKGKKDKMIDDCYSTWLKLKGYEIKCWNESNCNLNENEYVKENYLNGKYAFVSDYFRLKALDEYGGIYLDTDVFLYRNFDDLLSYDLFMGFIYDFSIGTAVIGATPHCFIIQSFLDQYKDLARQGIVNNSLVTERLKELLPDLKLNGKTQELKFNDLNVKIFRKEEFESGYIIRRSHSVHLCDGSWWRNDNIEKEKRNRIKVIAAKTKIVHIISIIKWYSAKKKLNEYLKRK